MDLVLKEPTQSNLVLLHYAQLIANTFTKGVEDNECILEVPIALHQELKQVIKDAEDANNLEKEYEDKLEEKANTGSPIKTYAYIREQSKINIKNDCLRCNIKLPKPQLEYDFDITFSKLKAHIELFTKLFKKPELNPCQALNLFRFTCVPDLIKIISLLLTAYISIMSILKISQLGINAFIQGIISGLLQGIMGSVKITIDLGQSNIDCIIKILRDIALAIPTEDNLNKRLDEAQLEALTSMGILNSKAGQQYSAVANNIFDTLYSASVEAEEGVKKAQAGIDEAFKLISQTVDEAVKTVNNYIKNLISFKDFFQCEATRSGSNVLEIAATIKNLILVLNLISSIVYAITKRSVRGLCKNKSTIANSTTEYDLIDNDLLLKDFLEDYYGNIVDVNNSDPTNLEVIVYQKPKKYRLPKIDLLDCSITPFIRDHNLENIIELAEKDVQEELLQSQIVVDKNPWETFQFKTQPIDAVNEIESLFKVIYSKPIINPLTPDEEVEVQKTLLEKLNIPPEYNSSFAEHPKISCRGVEDVLNILNDFKRK